MKKNLAATVAWRYLLSKKSHAAVGTISTVSLIAMAIATAAIICVLSVFNGFKDLIGEKLNTLSPDIMVTPVKGKVFEDAEKLAAKLNKMPEVELATPTLADNALIISNSKEMPVKLKGVNPEEYARVTSVKNLFPKDHGNYLPMTPAYEAGPTPAAISVGVAIRVNANPEESAIIFAPRREGRVNMANPASSFYSDSIRITGVYRTQQSQYDEDGIIVPIETARDLFMYDSEASALEIKLAPNADVTSTVAKIEKTLGPGFLVKDRMQQQQMNFRMIKIEKWISFLLLVFIMIIAGFNIISALSMLVLEKDEHIRTLSSLGMSRSRIGAVFAWESLYVAGLGGVIGVVLGLILCVVQQQFGLIKFGGDPQATIIPAYPVSVEPLDIMITLIPVVALGLITAAVTAAFARTRLSKARIA